MFIGRQGIATHQRAINLTTNNIANEIKTSAASVTDMLKKLSDKRQEHFQLVQKPTRISKTRQKLIFSRFQNKFDFDVFF
jgi:flagellar hook protein FlgE